METSRGISDVDAASIASFSLLGISESHLTSENLLGFVEYHKGLLSSK